VCVFAFVRTCLQVAVALIMQQLGVLYFEHTFVCLCVCACLLVGGGGPE